MSSTASSPRSPLGMRLDHHDRGLGGAAPPAGQHRELDHARPAPRHHALGDVPAPSVTSARSPTASRRTVAAWRPSGPARTIGRRPGRRGRPGRPAVWCAPGPAHLPAPSGLALPRSVLPRLPCRSLTRLPGQRPLNASRSREKNPCWPGANRPGGDSSPRSLASSLISASWSGSSLDGVSTVTWMSRSPRPEEFRCRALAVQRDRLAGLGARADVQVGRAVQGLHLQGRPERRGHHRDRHRAVQVVTLALEDRVRPLHDLEEQVPGGPAARTGLALPGQLDVRPVLDPGRDAHLDGAAGPDPAVARRTPGTAGG